MYISLRLIVNKHVDENTRIIKVHKSIPNLKQVYGNS